MAKHWIAGSISHPGALHRALGVKQGAKIPEGKLREAMNSRDPHMRKMAMEAVTLKKLNRPKR